MPSGANSTVHPSTSSSTQAHDDNSIHQHHDTGDVNVITLQPNTLHLRGRMEVLPSVTPTSHVLWMSGIGVSIPYFIPSVYSPMRILHVCPSEVASTTSGLPQSSIRYMTSLIDDVWYSACGKCLVFIVVNLKPIRRLDESTLTYSGNVADITCPKCCITNRVVGPLLSRPFFHQKDITSDESNYYPNLFEDVDNPTRFTPYCCAFDENQTQIAIYHVHSNNVSSRIRVRETAREEYLRLIHQPVHTSQTSPTERNELVDARPTTDLNDGKQSKKKRERSASPDDATKRLRTASNADDLRRSSKTEQTVKRHVSLVVRVPYP